MKWGHEQVYGRTRIDDDPTKIYIHVGGLKIGHVICRDIEGRQSFLPMLKNGGCLPAKVGFHDAVKALASAALPRRALG
jgi:hypothetical protein